MESWSNPLKSVVSQLDEKYPLIIPVHGEEQCDRFSSRLHYAALSSNSSLIELLIFEGLNPNIRNLYGETPLHWASKNGVIENVELLLAHGARVDPSDTDYNTPLHWAVEYNNVEVVDTLLAQGHPIECENIDLYTPLELACASGSTDTVSLLLNHHALLRNSLQIAIDADEPEVFQILSNIDVP